MQGHDRIHRRRSPFILCSTLIGVMFWGVTTLPARADDQTMPSNSVGQYEDESQEKSEDMNQESYRDADDYDYRDQTQIKYENDNQEDYKNDNQEDYEDMNQENYREDN